MRQPSLCLIRLAAPRTAADLEGGCARLITLLDTNKDRGISAEEIAEADATHRAFFQAVEKSSANPSSRAVWLTGAPPLTIRPQSLAPEELFG